MNLNFLVQFKVQGSPALQSLGSFCLPSEEGGRGAIVGGGCGGA